MTANPGEPTTAAPTTPQGRIPADTFSNRLLLVRALAGHLSIREACERTGLNRGNWQGWERGLRPRDQIEVSRIIAETFDIDLDWLIFGGPLLGARGRSTKRSGEVSAPYRTLAVRAPGTTVRPGAERPKVRTDQQRPMPPVAPGRRANRVNPVRATEDFYAA